eukprot:4266366-Prymnesium_polylepis.1
MSAPRSSLACAGQPRPNLRTPPLPELHARAVHRGRRAFLQPSPPSDGWPPLGVPQVRGQVDARALVDDVGGFDLRRMADEEGGGHEHAHADGGHCDDGGCDSEHGHVDGEHGHMDSEHGHMDSEHGHVDGEHGHMDEAPMAVVHAHDHAQVAHNHNKQVGSFSLVHDVSAARRHQTTARP